MKLGRSFLLISGITGAAYAQPYLCATNGPTNGGVNDQQLMDQASQYQQQMQQQSVNPSDCSQLSQQEQVFANQLSVENRALFCQMFSSAQRIEAMALASAQAQGINGEQTSISPDEAVGLVMKNSRLNGQSSQGTMQQNSSLPSSYALPSDGN